MFLLAPQGALTAVGSGMGGADPMRGGPMAATALALPANTFGATRKVRAVLRRGTSGIVRAHCRGLLFQVPREPLERG